jgi:hypothetical protein
MQLPGSLSQSTLGDLLGNLHRAGVSGTLALRETKGPRAGTIHRIHLLAGLVNAVELAVSEDAETAANASEVPAAATDRQHVLASMELLYHLPDARLSFHVARRRPESPRSLPTSDYLHGRPRHRDAGRGPTPQETAQAIHESKRARALSALGLPANASLTEAHRAFRMLALKLHPDHHGDVPEAERKAKTARFLSVLSAYQEVVQKAG